MAVNISTTLVIAIFIIIVAICIIFAIFVPANSFESSRVKIFLVTLAGLSIIIVFLFYLGLLDVYKQQIELATVQQTDNVNKSIFSFSDSLRLTAQSNPEFVASLNPLMNCPSGDIPKCTDRLILSYQEFSVWAGVVNTIGFANFDPLAYTTSFLQRCNSQELYADWKYLKINFSKNVQKFGDLLFEYGLPITQQKPEVYVKQAKKLLCNPEYRSILELDLAK